MTLALVPLRTNRDSAMKMTAQKSVCTTLPSLTTTRRNRAMATPDLPSPDQLRQLIDYDPATGKMVWKPRTPDMFEAGEPGVRVARTPEHKCANWNSKLAGKPALASVDARYGYLFGSLRMVRITPFKAHRVAWAIYHGAWPEGHIDHINGCTSDNRIANLRDVTHAENMRNQKLRVDNTSGLPGISWFAQTSRWHVRVSGYNRSGHVGFFKSIDDAKAARDNARAGLGYTGRGDVQ